MDGDIAHKAHHSRKTGAKAAKKRIQQQNVVGVKHQNSSNFKAFTVAHAGRKQKDTQRKLDRQHRKHVGALVNRASAAEEVPPVSIVVHGPPGSGKSTLIRSLVKKWTKHTLSTINGPVSVVMSKKRRVTLFECPNDVNAMTDLAKIADLVLLVIDASVGFEMETFEFLNVLQVHGFPKVIGVLTNLDKFKTNKSLKKLKKRLKDRFWTEIYSGAKLFYLSGTINNKYRKNEIVNLSRFISTVKFRPLTWRNTHPYMIVDRIEDVTDSRTVQEEPTCDRKVALFGYTRGTQFKQGMQIHLAGVGDFELAAIEPLADPCPLPDKESDLKRNRALNAKETLLYAPMSNVGNVMLDKDAVYINLPEVNFTNKKDLVKDDDDESDDDSDDGSSDDDDAHIDPSEGVKMVRDLQNVSMGMDDKMEEVGLKLFKGSKSLKAKDLKNSSSKKTWLEQEQEHDDESESESDENEDEDEDEDDEEEEEEEGSDEDESDQNVPSWKNNLLEKAADSFLQRKNRVGDIMDLVYGGEENINKKKEKSRDNGKGPSLMVNHDDDDESSDEEFFQLRSKKTTKSGKASSGSGEESNLDNEDVFDCSFYLVPDEKLQEWKDEEIRASIQERFVARGRSSENVEEDGSAREGDDESEVEGDFEDLEATGNGHTEQEQDDQDDEEMEEEQEEEEEEEEEDMEEARKRHALAKSMSKLLFNIEHDEKKEREEEDSENKKKKKDGEESDGEESDQEAFLNAQKAQAAEQEELNRTEFADMDITTRTKIQGVRAGNYVRIELRKVPCEFITNHDPRAPIIVGGLNPHESGLSYLRVRIKKHRWFPKVLKTNDPIIISLGWRRFQSLPVYAMEDVTTERQRMLKYTPEHMHCQALLWGAATAPNTGFIAYQDLRERQKGFRICATGTLLELDQSSKIVKKLKLVGEPYRIFKNTAFIKGMFNSELEVAKYEGAKIRTVSGVRGMIKKGTSHPAGAFRATFEDKILKSDIVFCRTWVPVEPKKFFNPITSLLRARPIAAPTDKEKRKMEKERLKKEQAALENGEDGIMYQEYDDEKHDAYMMAEDGGEALTLMKPVGRLRHEQNIPIPTNKDSVYRTIKRQPRKFNKLKISGSLQAQLPFASKPKLQTGQSAKAKARSRERSEKYTGTKKVAILSDHDKQVNLLLQQLNTIKKDKTKKRKDTVEEKRKERAKKLAQEEAKFAPYKKEEKKRKYRAQGIKEKHKKQKQ